MADQPIFSLMELRVRCLKKIELIERFMAERHLLAMVSEFNEDREQFENLALWKRLFAYSSNEEKIFIDWCIYDWYNDMPTVEVQLFFSEHDFVRIIYCPDTESWIAVMAMSEEHTVIEIIERAKKLGFSMEKTPITEDGALQLLGAMTDCFLQQE